MKKNTFIMLSVLIFVSALVIIYILFKGNPDITNVNLKPSPKNLDLKTVEAMLNEVTWTHVNKPYFEMIGAIDGQKYTVNDSFGLEVYIYDHLSNDIFEEVQTLLENLQNRVYRYKNVIFLITSPDANHWEVIKADLNA